MKSDQIILSEDISLQAVLIYEYLSLWSLGSSLGSAFGPLVSLWHRQYYVLHLGIVLLLLVWYLSKSSVLITLIFVCAGFLLRSLYNYWKDCQYLTVFCLNSVYCLIYCYLSLLCLIISNLFFASILRSNSFFYALRVYHTDIIKSIKKIIFILPYLFAKK